MLALFLINMFACSRWWRSNRRINDISERRSNGGSTEQHTTQARRETATHRKGEDTNGDGCEQAKATVRPTGFSTGCYEGELFVLKKYTCGRLTRNSHWFGKGKNYFVGWYYISYIDQMLLLFHKYLKPFIIKRNVYYTKQ